MNNDPPPSEATRTTKDGNQTILHFEDGRLLFQNAEGTGLFWLNPNEGKEYLKARSHISL